MLAWSPLKTSGNIKGLHIMQQWRYCDICTCYTQIMVILRSAPHRRTRYMHISTVSGVSDGIKSASRVHTDHARR